MSDDKANARVSSTEPVVQPCVDPIPEPHEEAHEVVDLEKQQVSVDGKEGLTHVLTHASAHDIPHVPYQEAGDEVYNRFSPGRKNGIVAVLSFCSFLAPMASTTILSAVPEVAATYNTTGTIVNISNALYMLFMGLSPM